MWEKISKAIIKAEFLPFEFMLSLLTLFSGLWILSPWFHAGDTPASSAALQTFGSGIAIWLIIIGGLHLISTIWFSWPLRWRVRRAGTYLHFITYFFLGVVRALTQGPSKIIWLTLIVLALTSALSYLSLSKWKP